MTDNEQYQRAMKRVEGKLGFFKHLCVYLIVNMFLIVINFSSSSDYLWVKWPIIGWGIGLIFNALSVFVTFDGSNIKEEMIQKELEKV